MEITKRILFAGLAMLSLTAFESGAQLHENISVEGKYVPQIIRIDRINMFPKAVRTPSGIEPLMYEESGVAASFAPTLLALPATAWRADRNFSNSRGYLELGAGSWLNSSLSAGYRFVDSSTTLLGVRLQHNSTSTWKPCVSDVTEDVRQFRYDESLAIYASQVVKGHGRLDAALDWHLGYFNYYGWFPPEETLEAGDKVHAPTQTLNDVAFRLDWKSLVRPSSSFIWNASFNIRHFAFRALPLPGEYGALKISGTRETEVGLRGRISMPWDNGSSIGLDASLGIYLPKGNRILASAENASGMENPLVATGNYAIMTLTPYWRLSRGVMDLRLGANADFSFNAGEKGHRYNFLHVSPDVRFAVQTGQLGFYANAGGGTVANTMSRLWQLDYYCMPAINTTRPSFSPLDATCGINIGSFGGFSAGLGFGYKIVRGLPVGGWYMDWLDYGNPAISQLPELAPGWKAVRNPLQSQGLDLKGWTAQARFSYSYGRTANISALATYQPQEARKGYFNGYDRARTTLEAKAEVRPIRRLTLRAGYELRAKRQIYDMTELVYNGTGPTGGTSIDGKPVGGGNGATTVNGKTVAVHPTRLADLSLLNFGVSWEAAPGLSVWAEGNNLLNRHDAVLPMQPTQGIVVTAGFKFIF